MLPQDHLFLLRGIRAQIALVLFHLHSFLAFPSFGIVEVIYAICPLLNVGQHERKGTPTFQDLKLWFPTPASFL